MNPLRHCPNPHGADRPATRAAAAVSRRRTAVLLPAALVPAALLRGAAMAAALLAATPPAPAAAQTFCPGGWCPGNPPAPGGPGRPTAPFGGVPGGEPFGGGPFGPSPAEGDVPSAALRAALRSVVQIDHRGYGGGSGVYLGDGLVLSVDHLFREQGRPVAGRIVVAFPGGDASTARLLDQDEFWDLALLQLDRPPSGATAAAWAAAPARPGEAVVSCGYGGRGELLVSPGRVRGYTFAKGQRSGPADTILLTGQARSGDSGGPIFCLQGRLVGVLWGAGRGEVVGTQLGRCQQFCRRWRTPTDQTPPGGGASGAGVSGNEISGGRAAAGDAAEGADSAAGSAADSADSAAGSTAGSRDDPGGGSGDAAAWGAELAALREELASLRAQIAALAERPVVPAAPTAPGTTNAGAARPASASIRVRVEPVPPGAP